MGCLGKYVSSVAIVSGCITKKTDPLSYSLHQSGHAATSVGLLTFILLELLMYHPNLRGKKQARVNSDTDAQESVAPAYSDYTFTWGYGWQERLVVTGGNNDLESSILESWDDQPRASPASISAIAEGTFSDAQSNIIHTNPRGKYLQLKWLHHYYAVFWTAVLLPVPFSRPYLSDHTPLQVLVGSIVGGVLGCIWYFCFIRGWLFRGDTTNRGLMKKLVNSHFGKSVGLNLGIDRWRFPDNVGCDGLDPIDSFFSDGDMNESYFMDN